MKREKIVLAGHLSQKFGEVPSPFYEGIRSNRKHYLRKEKFVSHIAGSRFNPEKFSEYPVFWAMFPLSKDIDCVGLFHYRCILNLAPKVEDDTTKSMSERKKELAYQSCFLEPFRSTLGVSKPLDFTSEGMSNWEQLLFCIPDIESDLLRMCEIFDSITDLSSEKLLKEKSKLYSRNIFVGPSEFANSWNEISLRVLKGLNESEFESKCDRPGGYILERLFSVYVENWMLTNRVIERPFVWFA